MLTFASYHYSHFLDNFYLQNPVRLIAFL